MSKIKDYLRFKNMNVSNARRNVPKDIKSLKSNFISTTPILCRMKVKPPCTRLFHNSIVAHQYTPHKRTKKKSLSALFQGVDKVDTLSRKQVFDLLKQRNKQTSSISLKALKPCQHFASQSRLRRRGISSPCITVFLVGSEFRLRIPFGKLLTAQEGAAGKACFAQQSNEQFVSQALPLPQKILCLQSEKEPCTDPQKLDLKI